MVGRLIGSRLPPMAFGEVGKPVGTRGGWEEIECLDALVDMVCRTRRKKIGLMFHRGSISCP